MTYPRHRRLRECRSRIPCIRRNAIVRQAAKAQRELLSRRHSRKINSDCDHPRGAGLILYNYSRHLFRWGGVTGGLAVLGIGVRIALEPASPDQLNGGSRVGLIYALL